MEELSNQGSSWRWERSNKDHLTLAVATRSSFRCTIIATRSSFLANCRLPSIS
ncbi:hypothetical protein Lser_V15G29259 [Lactuca serriola]